jgi:hypothetical protein
MKFFKFLLISIVISSSLVACRKGPEDPLLSFTTRKNRISQTWLAYSYRINGVEKLEESTTETNAIPGCGNQNVNTLITRSVIMDFSKGGTYSDNYNTITNTISSTTGSGESCNVFNFNNTDTDLTASVGIWNFSGGVGNTSSREQVFIYQEETKMGYLWDIVRLANDELKLKRKYIKAGESIFTTEEIFFYPK